MTLYRFVAAGLSSCVCAHHGDGCNSCVYYESIPMCMGPPCRSKWLLQVTWFYPHVYGATHKRIDSSPSILGLSPCVWGHWSYPVFMDSFWFVFLVLVRYCFS